MFHYCVLSMLRAKSKNDAFSDAECRGSVLQKAQNRCVKAEVLKDGMNKDASHLRAQPHPQIDGVKNLTGG